MFVFGIDAMPNLVKIAERINPSDWQLLERKRKYEIKTQNRHRPENVKQMVVIRRKFKKIQTVSEHVADQDRFDINIRLFWV